MPLSDLEKCHSSVIFFRLDLWASQQLNHNGTREPLPHSLPWAIYYVYRHSFEEPKQPTEQEERMKTNTSEKHLKVFLSSQPVA